MKTKETVELYLADESTAEENAVSQNDKSVVGEKPTLPPKKRVGSLGEITDMRTENRKVFRMNDGTQRAVFYPREVHTYDQERGVYEETNESMELDSDGRYYKTRRNHFSAQFSKQDVDNELFSVNAGNHLLTVCAKRPRRHTADIVVEKRKNAYGQDVVVFSDVFEKTDLEYTVNVDGVKENILVKEKCPVYKYPFVITCQNVAFEIAEEGKRILFKDTESGEDVFEITAPFMQDATGAFSEDVSYEVRSLPNGDVMLNVIADSGWINSSKRVFPITIDPQIYLATKGSMSAYGWNEQYMYVANTTVPVGTSLFDPPPVENGGQDDCGDCGCDNDDSCTVFNITSASDRTMYRRRMYLNIPSLDLPPNALVTKATLVLTQESTEYQGGATTEPILVRAVTGSIRSGHYEPSMAQDAMDYTHVKKGDTNIKYTFDITPAIDQYRMGKTSSVRIAVCCYDEISNIHRLVHFYGPNSYAHCPEITVEYTVGYDVASKARTHFHDIGRFGQGQVDLACGNLVFTPEDFAWAGNRMPVTLRHQYNSALSDIQYSRHSDYQLYAADYSKMMLGQGWRLNVMQSMTETLFMHEGQMYDGYVYIDERGFTTFFVPQCTEACTYFVALDGSGLTYDASTRKLKSEDMIYEFDTLGRLIKMQKAENEYNSISFSYLSGRLVSVIDGAGRAFSLGYSGNMLTSITAPDGATVAYCYDSCGHLTYIQYPGEKDVSIRYLNNKPQEVVLYQNGSEVYKVKYTFVKDMLCDVSEYGKENGEWLLGTRYTYNYDAGAARTEVITSEQDSEDRPFVTHSVYAFDERGNIASKYSYVDTDSGTDGTDVHLLYGGSVIVKENTMNLLQQHGTMDTQYWKPTDTKNTKMEITSAQEKNNTVYGDHLLRIKSIDEKSSACGAQQEVVDLSPGEYTFSAYVRPTSSFAGGENPGAFLRVTDADGNILSESEILDKHSNEYFRLIAPFTLKTTTTVYVKVLLNGKGVAVVNAPQLENNPYAGTYNMLEDGGFERLGDCWDVSDITTVNTYAPGVTPFCGQRVLKILGNHSGINFSRQTVAVRSGEGVRENFVLSGWAKAAAVPTEHHTEDANPAFGMYAVLYYEDGTSETTEMASFCPRTDAWQYAALQFSKKKYASLQTVTVYCVFGYNICNAYFDNIQLNRVFVEEDLKYEDFQEAKEEIVENEEMEPDEQSEEETPAFEEWTDIYGNTLTETTYADGEYGTIYRSFGYTEDCNDTCCETVGNDLIRETDARGFVTQYRVDPETSRREEMIDRCGNKTVYAYDTVGRRTAIFNKDCCDNVLSRTHYGYDVFNNLVGIARGDGMGYALDYDCFRNLRSIGVNGKNEKLISYDYKNSNGKLKEIVYANGDRMRTTYNSLGQLLAEKWYTACDCDNPIAHYKYAYDKNGNIIQLVDMLAKRAYTYQYENGRIVRSKEFVVAIDTDEMITSRTVVTNITYAYTPDGQLSRKSIMPADGEKVVYTYDISERSSANINGRIGDIHFNSVSKTDSLGRKEFDELQFESGFVSRRFYYHDGVITKEHKDGKKIKSAATTQLVSRITLSDGRTIDYEYDPEERITKVVDSMEGVTEYTYDALGQLLTETHNGERVNTMVYDGYGNIVSKNGVCYTYDSTWKDLLIGVCGDTITYDAQGNPTSYLAHSLAWEKGRQLKSFDDISYTYNANGIRTSKTVDGIRHDYLLDGAKILREEWNGNTLIPLYDNEDSVCGIVYNGTPYYFLKNLQKDIIALVNTRGDTVARYTYDAWGKCTIVQDNTDCDIASVNPYRYRGYYYDVEIGMYYLQSRCYDPENGRFINADVTQYLMTSQTNLFVYCVNDPISRVDAFGFCETSTYPQESRQKKADNFFETSWKVISMVGLMVGAFLANTILEVRAFLEKNQWIEDAVSCILIVLLGLACIFQAAWLTIAITIATALDALISALTFDFSVSEIISNLLGFGAAAVAKTIAKIGKASEEVLDLIERLVEYISRKFGKNISNKLI